MAWVRLRRVACVLSLVLAAGPHCGLAQDLAFKLRFLRNPAPTSRDAGIWTDNLVTPDGNHHVAYSYIGNPEVPVVPSGVQIVQDDWTRSFVVGSITPEYTFLALGLGRYGTPHFAVKPADRFDVWIVVVGIGGTGSIVNSLRISSSPSFSYFLDEQEVEHVAYFGHSLTTDQLVYATPTPGGEFGDWDRTTVDDADTYIPDIGRVVSMVPNRFEEPRIAYVFGTALKFAERNGGEWSVQTVYDQGDIGHVDLAVTAGDEPHISFYAVGARDLMYAVRRGGSWTVEVASSYTRVGTHSSISVDGAGVPHLSSYRATDRSLVYSRPVATGWSTQVVDNTASVGEYSSIATDAYGALHIAYYDATNNAPKEAWWMDCNANGVHDVDDIAAGLLADCDGNQIADDCEALYGFIDDCNVNGVPDACEPDCDGDGVLDECEILSGDVTDCDRDGVPDECQGLWLEATVNDGGFESLDVGPTPETFGSWGHDLAEAVTAEGGVTPSEGDRMLKFVAAHYAGSTFNGGASDIYQFVGLCNVSGVANGTVRAIASAEFNSVAGDAETDRLFGIRLGAYAGSPGSFGDGSGYLATAEAQLVSDADPSTWEALGASLTVPAGSDYVAVWLLASEDVFNDDRVNEFDGHYCDNVQVWICDTTLDADPVIVNPGFEDQQLALGTPHGLGIWSGDLAASVPAENGIVPLDESRMLKFEATSSTGPRANRYGSDIQQLVSLCRVPNVASGQITATARASYNRVAGDAETDTQFSLLVQACSGLPADFGGTGDLGQARTDLFSDADPASWEEVTVSLLLPPDAAYLVIWLYAHENVFNDGTTAEFDGHYCDGVQLSFTDGTLASVPLGTPVLRMRPPYPNPFTDVSTLLFEVSMSRPVNLRFYDLAGRLVRSLGPMTAQPGQNFFTWDGRDDSGRAVAAGAYLYSLESGVEARTGRVIIVK